MEYFMLGIMYHRGNLRIDQFLYFRLLCGYIIYIILYDGKIYIAQVYVYEMIYIFKLFKMKEGRGRYLI